MKKKFALYLTLFLFVARPVLAQDNPGSAKLRLPWDQIQSLLQITDRPVTLTWDEYQTLLKHAQKKSWPTLSINNGKIVLARDEFKRLIDQLIPPSEEANQTSLTKGSYQVKLLKNHALVTAKLELHLKNAKKSEEKIDLLPSSLAFHEVTINGEKALIKTESGRLYLLTSAKGPQTIKIVFSIPKPKVDSQNLTFPIARTPITLLDLELPDKDLDVQVTSSLHAKTENTSQGSHVSAILSPTNAIAVQWNPLSTKTGKGTAHVYVNAESLMSVEDDALRVKTNLNLQVLKNTINQIDVRLPEGFEVVSVTGQSIGQWEEITRKKEGRLLHIPLPFAQKGYLTVQVVLEQLWGESEVTSTFSGLPVEGAVREKGFIGVELKTSAETTAPSFNGLNQVDIQELPSGLISMSNRPLLFGFQFLRYPLSLELHVKRHQDVQLISSVIDSAQGTTWIKDNGEAIHHLTYRLRNSWKPFMEIELPNQVQLWSAFVSGQPVKPTINEEGRLLIPLNRSQDQGQGLYPFSVELIYFEKSKELGWLGESTFQFPVPDMVVSRLEWTLYHPNDQQFSYWGSDLTLVPNKPAPMPVEYRRVNAPQAIAVGDGRVTGKEKDALDTAALQLEEQLDENSAAQSAQLKDDVVMAKKREYAENVLAPSLSQVAGVLPIRVNVPLKGQKLQFSKSLLTKAVPVNISLTHMSVDLYRILTVFLLMAFSLILFINRARLSIWIKPIIKNNKVEAKFLRPILTPFGLLITFTFLTLISSSWSKMLTVIFMIGFLMALARWLLIRPAIHNGEIK